jgi:hypothetical protein
MSPVHAGVSLATALRNKIEDADSKIEVKQKLKEFGFPVIMQPFLFCTIFLSNFTFSMFILKCSSYFATIY